MLTVRKARPDASLDGIRLALAAVRAASEFDEALQQVAVGSTRVVSGSSAIVALERNGRYHGAATAGAISRDRVATLISAVHDVRPARDLRDVLVVPLVADMSRGALIVQGGRRELVGALELFAEAAGAALDARLLQSRVAAAAHRIQTIDRVGSVIGSIEPGDGVAIVAVEGADLVRARWGDDGVDSVLQAAGLHLLHSTRPPGDVVAHLRAGQFLVVLRGLKAPVDVVAQRVLDAWRATRPAAPLNVGAAVHLQGRPPLETVERAEVALASAIGVGGGQVHVSPP